MSKIDPKDCKHFNFQSNARVGRLTDSDNSDEITGFTCDFKVVCIDCDTPFEFIGVSCGVSFTKPMANFDFTELRVPIRPSTGKVADSASYQFEPPKPTKNENRN